MPAVHGLVSGKVQGVFFRKYTQATASELKLTGWVRNLEDGRVEFLAEGDPAALEALVTWCREKGSPKSKVTGVEVEEVAASGAFQGFSVKK